MAGFVSSVDRFLSKRAMFNNKLILIEGLGGSGKTSTVSYLNNFLRQRNVDVTAIYERSDSHPKFIFPRFVENYAERMLEEWQRFLHERERVDDLCVMEGHGWQPTAEFMHLAGYSHNSVFDLCNKIEALISPLNPIVIFYKVVFGGSLLNFWREWTVLHNEIFNRCSFPKLCVEDPYDDWEATYKKVVSFM